MNPTVLNWSAIIALALAVIASAINYGQLSQRVQALEDLQPVAVSTKLAVIESNQVRNSTDLNAIKNDLAEIRRQLQRAERRDGYGAGRDGN